MKARLLHELIGAGSYIVADFGDYVGIGGVMCHNIISLDKKTLKLTYAFDSRGKVALENKEPLLAIWNNLEHLICSGEMDYILRYDDEIENPIIVYTFKSGRLLSNTTDRFLEAPYPNLTADGQRIDDNNMYYLTKEEALKDAQHSLMHRISTMKETLSEILDKKACMEAMIEKAVDELLACEKLLSV